MLQPGMLGSICHALLKRTSVRAKLFMAVMAVALVDSYEARSGGAEAIEIGRRLCDASVNGTPLLYDSSSIPNVVFVGEYLAKIILHENRRYFVEDCQLELRYGDLWRGRWPHGDADYFVVFRSNGEVRASVRLKRTSRFGGRFDIRVVPSPRC